jgi:competence protein ComEC
MVAGLAFLLMQGLWCRSEALTLRLPARKAATAAGLAVAFAYALLAGFAVPTQRTVYMLAVLAAALWWGRSISMSLALCWALLAVVLLDSWAVIAPGFWLSFGAVSLLLYAGSYRLGRPNWLKASVRAQWVIALGLTPLLLALFQQVSIISPLANALAIPVVSLVVTPLALLGAILPVDAILHLAHAAIAGCMRLLQLAAEWPLAVWQQHAPPTWAIVAGVAGVVWMLLPRGFPLRWAGAVGLAPMLLLLPPVLASGELQVAALDVGQGTAVVLRTARHTLLYDAGPKYSAEADSGNRIVIPYLRGEGVRRLDGMLVSHDDLDHSGGALSVLQNIPVGWLAAPLLPSHALRGHARRDLYCLAGQDWSWDGVHFEVLHPAPTSYADDSLKDNDRSCVLKATSPYGSVLLAGDIERLSEAALTESAAGRLKSDILLVPHHGSKTSSTPAFIEQVQPAAAVFTMGYRNRFGHPKPEVVERYQALGSHLYRSDRDGAVIFDLRNPDEIEAARWRQSAPRYWHDSPAGVDENAPAG